jgi:hypothetical protein
MLSLFVLCEVVASIAIQSAFLLVMITKEKCERRWKHHNMFGAPGRDGTMQILGIEGFRCIRSCYDLTPFEAASLRFEVRVILIERRTNATLHFNFLRRRDGIRASWHSRNDASKISDSSRYCK